MVPALVQPSIQEGEAQVEQSKYLESDAGMQVLRSNVATRHFLRRLLASREPPARKPSP
jgi:hypothetical protein